jgi:hypothetical protein
MIHVLHQRLAHTKLPLRWVAGILIAAAVILLAPRLFSSLTPERTAKVSADWSRGLRLGEGVNGNPIALWVNSAGDRVVAVSSRWVGDEQVLQWTPLNRAGAVLDDHDLTINLRAPRQAQLLTAPNGYLHLYFTALHEVNYERALFGVSLDAAGNPRGAPVAISDAGLDVSSFAVVLRGDRAQAFWAGTEGEASNLYTRALDSSGKELGSAVLLAPRAENPDARVDQTGALHLVWMDQPPGSKALRSLYYALIPPNADLSAPPQSTRIGNGQGISSDNVWGPKLGLTSQHLYALWGIEHRSGLAAGSLEAYYVGAPLGTRDFSEPVRFGAPEDANINYAPYRGSLDIRELAPLQTGRVYFNGATLNFVTPSSQLAELPVILTLNVLRGFNPVRKISLLLFADGKPKGYAVVGQTDQGSLFPSLAADGRGDLYITWFDQGATGSRNATIYFASTTPEAKSNLDRWTPQDVVLSLINSVWGMSSGLGVIPLALAWSIPGLLFAAVFQLLRVDADMSFLPEKIAMGCAVVLYLAFKLTLLPGTFVYVPFSAWVPMMPELLAMILRVATPVLILMFALGLSYYLIVRTNQRQLLWMYIFFVFADIAATVVLYGPSFFGQ